MYPVNWTADYGDGTRNRGLAVLGIFFLKLVALLPHAIVLGILGIAAFVATWVNFLIIVFTGSFNEGVFGFLGGYYAWSNRVGAWLIGLTDEYPPFAFDAPGYPATLTMPLPEQPSKGLAALGILPNLKQLALLPHQIVLVFIWIAAFFAIWAGYIAVAVTGRFPAGLFRFLRGALQWQLRLQTWWSSLVDEYPPFSLE